MTSQPLVEEWMEIDCPRCGLDFDLDPVPTPGCTITCSCGHKYTDAELAKGQILVRDEDPLIVRVQPNPFKRSPA